MKKLFLISVLTCLGGCASSNHKVSWITHYDQPHQPIKEMTFLQNVFPKNKKPKKFDEIGSFLIKGRSYIPIFKYDQEKSFSLINSDKKNPIKKINDSTLNKLGAAKKIKFYEFGKGILEVVEYQSTNGICKDFFSSRGVHISFVTNYYVGKATDSKDFFTTFSSAKLLAKKGVQNTKTNIVYNLKNKSATIIKKIEKEKQQMTIADAQKLGRFLFLICKPYYKNNLLMP